MSVLQGLRRACQINPQGVATVDGDRRQTWLQFRDRVARFAGALQAAGVGRGDRVAILSLNGAAYLEYFYAAPWAGVTVVPLNTRLAAPELVAIINDSGAVGLLVDDAFAAMLPALIPGLITVRSIWVAGPGAVPAGATSLDAAIEAAAPIGVCRTVGRRSLRDLLHRRDDRGVQRRHAVARQHRRQRDEHPGGGAIQPRDRLPACRADVPPGRLHGDVRADDCRRAPTRSCRASIRWR